MTDLNIKLRLLLKFYGFSRTVEWYQDIWKRDGAERMCCDGQHCGCRGADYYTVWKNWLR